MGKTGSVAAAVLLTACLRSCGIIVESEHYCRSMWWKVGCQKQARFHRKQDCAVCFPLVKSDKQAALEAEAIAFWRTLW